MSEHNSNAQTVGSQSDIGRRQFIGAAMGGAVAATGILSDVNVARSATRPDQDIYREVIQTPVVARYDVVVAGGGPSGVIAALAAARSGADTLLIERYGFLGGNGTAGLMTCYNGFRNQQPPEALQSVKGIPAQYIADIVIDATGDGDIAARAGASVVKSPAKKGDLLRMTLMYRLGGISVGSDKGGICIGERVVKWGPAFQGDGTDVETLTEAEVKTRLELWDQIEARRSKPGMESVYLMQTATGIGVRETRHILGGYVLTVQNAIKGTRFPDVVAISSNPMAYQGKRYFYKHEGFDIPYRSLVPNGVENIVLSGRCISAEQDPFWSARAMAGVMAIGHASGCAAAMAAKGDVPPRTLDVKALQNLLLSQNAELRMGKLVT